MTRGLVSDRGNRYGAVVHHPWDGDTSYCTVWDPVIQLPVVVGVRVRGIQAPELHDPGGPDVAAYLRDELLPVGDHVVVGDVGPYPRAGHITASITTAAGVDVAARLLSLGYAVPYNGTGIKPMVPWPPVPRSP